MSFELDCGCSSETGRKALNEDFAGLLLGQGRDRERGAIAAIADGVSAGGNGREAAQTTVNTLVNDYFATPDTWDTTVALDRILSAHNGWLASMNRLTLRESFPCALLALWDERSRRMIRFSQLRTSGPQAAASAPEPIFHPNDNGAERC